MSKAFTIDTTGYTQSFEDNINAGKAKVVYTKGETVVEKTFNITKATIDGLSTAQSLRHSNTAAQTIDIPALVSSYKKSGDGLIFKLGFVYDAMLFRAEPSMSSLMQPQPITSRRRQALRLILDCLTKRLLRPIRRQKENESGDCRVV